MQGDKAGQEISILGRLCSLEALVLVMGAVSIVYGVVAADWSKALLGVVVLSGALLLLQLSRRWCRGTVADKEKKE